MYLDGDKFGNMFNDIKRSAFRLQLLDAYSVEFEREDYNAFMSGQPLPDRDGNAWLKTIAANVAAGHQWINIHVLPERLTNYLRYIIDWWYVYHAKAGAEIRFVRGGAGEEIRSMAEREFWLFDDEKVVWMDYNAERRFLGGILSTDVKDVAVAKLIRDKAISDSINLTNVLSLRRQGLLI
jgi:hypothetical protein